MPFCWGGLEFGDLRLTASMSERGSLHDQARACVDLVDVVLAHLVRFLNCRRIACYVFAELGGPEKLSTFGPFVFVSISKIFVQLFPGVVSCLRAASRFALKHVLKQKTLRGKPEDVIARKLP